MHDGLVAADARIRSRPELSHTLALLVAHRREIVCERYYRGSGPHHLHDVHSVTKSFTSTLVGILAGEGLLALDAPIASYVPVTDLTKRSITVRHLLTMSSGLYGHGWWDVDELGARGEPVVAGVLAAPLVAPPGWGFLYNNGAAHVLSAIVESVTGARMRRPPPAGCSGPWASTPGTGRPTPKAATGAPGGSGSRPVTS